MKLQTIRRRPNWEHELLKDGMPMTLIPQLPENATHSDKTKRAFALKALWERRTGRKAPRSTPEGYNKAADERRAHRLQIQGDGIVSQ